MNNVLYVVRTVTSEYDSVYLNRFWNTVRHGTTNIVNQSTRMSFTLEEGVVQIMIIKKCFDEQLENAWKSL